jgi:hypothetical protein
MRYLAALAILGIFVSQAIAISPTGHSTSGVIVSINGSLFTVKTRTGMARIDISAATANHRVGQPLAVGLPITALGDQIGGGALLATSISRAKSQNQFWPADR